MPKKKGRAGGGGERPRRRAGEAAEEEMVALSAIFDDDFCVEDDSSDYHFQLRVGAHLMEGGDGEEELKFACRLLVRVGTPLAAPLYAGSPSSLLYLGAYARAWCTLAALHRRK